MPLRFGDAELDPGSRELRVAGRPVEVEPLVFDLLACFAEHPGEVLSQDDLIRLVWQGRIVSDSAIAARISAARAAVGDDGARQAVIRTVPRRGFKMVAEVPVAAPRRDGAQSLARSQRVQFCRSADGTRLAWSTIGSGPPLLRAGHWLTHLEHDWASATWRPFLGRLAQDFSLTRYDQRGNGLSSWDATDFTLDRMVEDLEAVADAAGLSRFPIYGCSQGAPIAVRFAVRHPERVSALILHGGFAQGRVVRDPQSAAQSEALQTLIRTGWGRPGGHFVQAFSSLFIPGGSREQLDALSTLLARSTTAENAIALRHANDHFDVVADLPRVAAPTLVLHARADGIHPASQGLILASGIPGAAFVELDSINHILLDDEPAFETMIAEIAAFLGV